MDLPEHVERRVRAKTDRYRFWLKCFTNPMVVTPSVMAMSLSPLVALKLAGGLGCASWTLGLISLLVYAYTNSARTHDVARDIFWRPVWGAFCAVVQGRKDARYTHLHMKPMHRDNAAWQALITKEEQAYRCYAAPPEITNDVDWIALRTIEWLIREGDKELVWEE